MPKFRPTFRCYVIRCLFILMGLWAGMPRAGALDTDKSLAQCRLDVWTARDGLPGSISAMAQTPDGYLWFATDAGLVRFDGVAFQTYNAQNTVGLRRSAITSILAAADGKLLVGTDGGGFGIFRGGAFERSYTGIRDDSWSVTKAILEARDGTRWLGGGGEHNLLHEVNGRFTRMTAEYQYVLGLAEDRQGTVWSATRYSGLHGYLPDGRVVSIGTADGLPTMALTCIVLDSDNSLWIGTAGAGLCHYSGGRCTTYTTRNGLSSNEINALCFDHEGSLWVGTRVGLDRLMGGHISSFRKTDGLADVGVTAVFEDREGSLWVGAGTGLNRFRNTKLTPINFPTREGLANTSSAALDPDGGLWFGTDKGLMRLKSGHTTTFTSKDGVPGDQIASVCSARDGSLWIVTAEGAICRRFGGRFQTVVRKSPWRLIAEDREGMVVANTDDYARLAGGKFTPIPHSARSEYVFNSYRDRDGTLWFAASGGLAHLVNNQVDIVRTGLPPGAHVLSIARWNRGPLWLGTDKGLVRYDHGVTTVFDMSAGLPDDNLFLLLFDSHGALWVGGARGVFSLSVADLNRYRLGNIARIPTRLFDSADGIRAYPTGAQALRLPSGMLMFLGLKGATLVDPDRLATDFVPPPILIESVMLDKKPVPTASLAGIKPGKGDLEIHYTALALSDAERVSFRYRLAGYDRDWVDAGSRRVAYYTNLPPGDYRFDVIAQNGDGIWNRTGAGVGFTLTPFFYQTILFKVAAILLLGIASWGAARMSLYRLRVNNQRLEEKVAERTEELRRSKEQVEEANRSLRALATTDGMTGLANHRAFQEQLRFELEASVGSGEPVSLLLLDVDKFKMYNDSFGHPAGDEVLRRVARLISQNIRAEDYAARYGGEEFAVLLPGTTEAVATEIAERLRGAVAGCAFPCRRVTLSIGVARAHTPGSGPEELIAMADGALYAAKHGGRNRVALATGDPLSVMPREIEPVVFADSVPDKKGDPLMSLFHRQDGHVLSGIMALLNLRDPETDGHSHRVTRFALRLAQEVICQDIAALSPDDLRDLTLGSLLHDIGKIGVPDAVLFKPGALTEEEWKIIRAHPEQGAMVLEAFSNFVCALPVVRSHHEKWDGTGYPQGLAGERIPLVARIFALADTLDAMSSDRPYRAALPYALICAEIVRMAGTQFDPSLVEAFLGVPEAEWERLRSETIDAPRYVEFPTADFAFTSD